MSSAKPAPVLEALTSALNVPIQKREDSFYEPRQQGYYSPSPEGTWQLAQTNQTHAPNHSLPALNRRNIRLISWNIDVLTPFHEERMSAALTYLDELVFSTPPDVAIVVFLQEMGTSDMQQIRESVWIKKRFYLTDVDETSWLSPYYGTTMLVDRRLQINSVFRVPWYSKFDRDGLFVDICISESAKANANPRFIRLCNTHLESLVADPPVRPIQIAVASQYLHQSSVSCGVVAGDLNAIQPFDRTLHTENKLNDAYLMCGGSEDSEDGYTWGQQVPEALRNRFGCSRMDKILYMGSIQPTSFERIGIDVKVAEEHRQKMREAGQLEWVTDHYGVMADFVLLEGGELGQIGQSAML
ncbi:hypothetical protein ACJQWK_08494 [Exserohilum turcicum]|uniref:Endonuclease/exonuclease/phosphatase domain-containing protein n=1 Tax=Exserohilum turcicum (strain 28A) TaxID=671987 RepID=R0KFB1_EXST2|nr:uncharacterized protein SETTUDRAFT_176976 [Exserohilum turcica Et28A]EOA88004.1 hypothetical protein SETTUDRAFT_176976 [Exserohilum turcica Et28A]